MHVNFSFFCIFGPFVVVHFLLSELFLLEKWKKISWGRNELINCFRFLGFVWNYWGCCLSVFFLYFVLKNIFWGFDYCYFFFYNLVLMWFYYLTCIIYWVLVIVDFFFLEDLGDVINEFYDLIIYIVYMWDIFSFAVFLCNIWDNCVCLFKWKLCLHFKMHCLD